VRGSTSSELKYDLPGRSQLRLSPLGAKFVVGEDNVLNFDRITMVQSLQVPPANVIDYAGALDRLEGDTELLAEMAGLFLEDSAQQLSAIRAAIARSDASALERAAHCLKGAIANFAAHEAFGEAEKLEKIALTGDLKEVDPACWALDSALQQLNNALASIAYV
jgi:HPt (histidine-containing phosphotransfer) domain-containing protein